MNLSCAAKALCGMKSTPLPSPAQHHCILCKDGMHGAAFCGANWQDNIVDDPTSPYDIPADLFDEETKAKISSTTVICHCCIQKLPRKEATTTAAATTTTASTTANNTAAAASTTAPPPNSVVFCGVVSDAAPPAPKTKKNRDDYLYSQYHVTPFPDGSGARYKCRHCGDFDVKWKIPNATRLRSHSTRCSGLTDPIAKRRLEAGSQSNKRKGSQLALQSHPNESVTHFRARLGPQPSGALIDLSSSDSEEISDITTSSSTPAAKKTKIPTKKTPSTQTYLPQTYEVMKKEVAEEIIMAEVTVVLARGEPLSRMLDPHYQQSLNLRHPALLKFLPTNTAAIYDKYVVKIDEATTMDLQDFIKKVPGHVNVAMDGVTANGKQKIVHTVAKGNFSIFLEWADLGSKKHVTSAEVEDAVRVCEAVMKQHNAKIVSIPVDNAARHVAAEAAKELELKYPGMKVLVTRDPAHCIDLLMKDLAKTGVMQRVIAVAKKIRDFVNIDRIDSIRRKAAQVEELLFYAAVFSPVDTRMNLIHDVAVSARKCRDFLMLLPGNAEFQTFLGERSQQKKAELEELMQYFKDENIWKMLDMVIAFTLPFKEAHLVCSSQDTPLSVYVLLVQALRNDINKRLTPDFDALLGEGSRAEVAGMIRERFNMNGQDPEGRKVGLLDLHHLMCFLCDPKSRLWRQLFHLQTDKALLVRKMIEWYVPLGEDGSDEMRRKVRKDFEAFDSQTGDWFHTFDTALLDVPSREELEENNKSFGIKDVVKYSKETGAITGRLQWFECYAGSSDFYRLVAKPLLSMGTVGSMDCERRAKPMKNLILTRDRNRLLDPTGVALLRSYENLRHIMNAKMALGKRATDPL